jgi:branched-chain amino acid transport system permease protein
VHDKIGVPLLPAMLVGLGASVLMALATERLVVRRLFDAPRVTLLVATAGVSLLAISLELWLGEARLRFIQPALGGLSHLKLFDVQVSDQRMLVLAALLLLAVMLGLFFSRTNLGLAILAVSQEPVATELMGVSVRRLSSFIWGLTGLLAGIAGMLTAPVIGSFGPGFLTFNALIPGFTAAVIGGMNSLPGAFVGGIVVGVAQSLAVSSPAFHSIPGAGSVMVFVLLLAVLTVRPQGLLGKA